MRAGAGVGVCETDGVADSDPASVVGVTGVDGMAVGVKVGNVNVGRGASVGRGDGCSGGTFPSVATTGKASRPIRKSIAPTLGNTYAAMCVLDIFHHSCFH
jgi:hypothetical protein